MSPRTEIQFEEIRSTRKLQIMEAALEIFANEGYDKASIARIAQTAKISKGLIYNYFSSKEALLKAILIQGLQGFNESFAQAKNQLQDAEELEIFIKGGMNILRQDAHYYKLYFRVMLQPAAYAIVQENYAELIGELITGIASYFEAKGAPHPMEKATLLAATMDGFGMYYLMTPEAYNLEIFEKLIVDLFK